MKILALAGQKGGAGKSMLAIALAAEAHRRGKRVLLVDADPQGTSATWGDVAAQAQTSHPDVIMQTGAQLAARVRSVGAQYDLVVIDCPGRDGAAQRAALVTADLVLLPVTPDISELWAMAGTLELVEEARGFKPALDARLVLNRMRPGTAEAVSAHELLAGAELPILDTVVGMRVTWGRFAAAGAGVVEFEPKGQAAEEIQRLFDEIAAILTLEAVASQEVA